MSVSEFEFVFVFEGGERERVAGRVVAENADLSSAFLGIAGTSSPSDADRLLRLGALTGKRSRSRLREAVLSHTLSAHASRKNR